MTFAAAIARANVAVFRHLADVRASLDNVAVSGVYDNPYATALNGMATRQPRFQLLDQYAVRTVQGSTLRIIDGAQAGTRYRVSGVEPDGTGVTTLLLERQP